MYQDLKNENAQVKWWKKMLNIGPVLFLEIGNSQCVRKSRKMREN